jgi:cellulose synthase/poly-beta-1,6-N-acetylglucosamine synthase-like glycosyltransferase
MCNGANLCYRKEAFLECGGFDGIEHTASGDDELLMHRVFAIWPDGVKFLKSREAVVTTAPAATIGDFLSQRKRWVSKSRLYERKGITWVMMGCYLFNLALLVSFVAGFFMPGAWVLLLLLLTLKLSGEYLFLKKVTTFFGQEQLMRPFAAGSLLHIFYVLLIGIYGNFGRYNWKGRRLK